MEWLSPPDGGQSRRGHEWALEERGQKDWKRCQLQHVNLHSQQVAAVLAERRPRYLTHCHMQRVKAQSMVPPPPRVQEPASFSRGTRGWFLGTSFMLKNAAEPRSGSCTRPWTALFRGKKISRRVAPGKVSPFLSHKQTRGQTNAKGWNLIPCHAIHMKYCPACLKCCPSSTTTVKPTSLPKKSSVRKVPRNQGLVLADGGGGVDVADAHRLPGF